VTQTAGSAGGVAIPWLQGVVLLRVGALASSLLIAGLAAGLLGLAWRLPFRGQRAAAVVDVTPAESRRPPRA
jgi:hypothetical protein